MAGDGLVRPLNAPPAAALAPGVQPGVSGGIVTARYVIVFGTNDGVFVYSGAPRSGNPPVAWVSNAAADPYGNALPATGIVSWDSVGLNYSQLLSGNVVLAHTPWNAPADITLSSPVAGALRLVSPAVNPGDTRCDFQLIPSPSAAPTGAINRLSAWQPGLAGNTVETWHAMTLLNGWSAAGGYARYRLMEDNSVWVEGRVVPGTIANGTAVWTPPAGYAAAASPGNQVIELVVNASTAAAQVLTPHLNMQGAGSLVCQNVPNPSTLVSFNGRYALD